MITTTDRKDGINEPRSMRARDVSVFDLGRGADYDHLRIRPHVIFNRRRGDWLLYGNTDGFDLCSVDIDQFSKKGVTLGRAITPRLD